MSARGNRIANGCGIDEKRPEDVETAMAYLEIWDKSIIVPQRLRVFGFEEGGGLFPCPKARIRVIKVGRVGVAPGKLADYWWSTLSNTHDAHQPYTVPDTAVCSG